MIPVSAQYGRCPSGQQNIGTSMYNYEYTFE